MSSNHTFAICAYKESEYLEDCIISLKEQTEKSRIIICTSTPNNYISSLANKYNIPVFVNYGESGIGQDWNFALSKCETQYVTIAHQDDIYFKDYLYEILIKMQQQTNAIIGFTEYSEIRNGELVNKNKLLRIKRLMNYPIRLFPKSRFVRNRVLSLGSSICCPSVTYNTQINDSFTFDTNFKCNLDWDAWSRLAKKKGAFVYLRKSLMGHRIHEKSETTSLLDNGLRFNEDLTIYRRYHPNWLCKIIHNQYKKSAESNKLK